MSRRSPYNRSDYIELYTRLGGALVIERAAILFCDALINEPALAAYFVAIDQQKLRANMIAFFAMVCGGPNAYAGRDLRTAHAAARGQGLSEAQMDIAMRLGRDAFAAAGAVPDLVQEVALYLQSMRDDILGL
jgi:hemoglobin